MQTAHELFIHELGEEPEETECRGVKGLLEEYDTFKEEEDPAEDLMDIFNVAAAAKVENYEICAYESLISLAQELGETKAVRMLNQNLKEEQQTLKKMQQFSKKLKPENLGTDEEDGQQEAVAAGRKRASSAGSRSRGSRAA